MLLFVLWVCFFVVVAGIIKQSAVYAAAQTDAAKHQLDWQRSIIF